MSISRFLIFLLFYIIVTTPTLARSNSFDAIDHLYTLSLEELSQIQVVTAATGYTQKLEKAPATITVIESIEWESKGALTLEQALNGVAGLQVMLSNEGNTEFRPSIRGLKGTYGQQVKVLIDGTPINRIHHGGMPGLALPLLGFKRIEVIRNSGSVVYGADAFGGIINLVSNDFSKDKSQASVSLGDFDSRHIGVITNQEWNNIQFKLALNYFHTGVDKQREITSDLQTSLDSIFGTNASKAPGYIDLSQDVLSFNFGMKWDKLNLDYFIYSGDYGPGVGVAETLDPQGVNEHQSQIIKATYDLSEFSDNLSLKTWYQQKQSTFHFTIFPAGTVLPIGSDGNLNFSSPTSVALFDEGYIGYPGNKTEMFNISLSQQFAFNKQHQIRWELGYENQNHRPYESKNFGPGILNGTETYVSGVLTDVTNTPYVYLPKTKRNFHFFSFQDTWQLNANVALHLGARYDNYSDFGETFNPRLGVTWRVNTAFDVRFFTGAAFRAPSFIGLYSQNNPVGLGNKDLQPEEIDSHELSFDYQVNENLQTSITLFSYQADKLVSYTAQPNVVGLTATNVGQLEAQGFEWQMRWRPLPELDFNANYSYIDTEDMSKLTTPDYAHKMASLTINYQLNNNLSANVFTQFYGEQERRLKDARATMKDFYWISSKIKYQFNNSPFSLALLIKNLTDEKHAKYPSSGSIKKDYPFAGRQLLLQMNYQF